MKRIFAIGDVHGCYKTFQYLLRNEIQLQKSDKIYCIGDYIDRGRDSKKVIDLILKLRKNGYKIHTLRGNHEQMMIDSTIDNQKFKKWIRNGGTSTLESFGISSFNDLKPIYKNFFLRTKYYIESSKYIFVHAGINFKKSNPLKNKTDLLWIRDFPIDKEKLGQKIIIHGHTPTKYHSYFINLNVSSINIDGGCVFKEHKDYGNLIALNLSENKFIIVKNID